MRGRGVWRRIKWFGAKFGGFGAISVPRGPLESTVQLHGTRGYHEGLRWLDLGEGGAGKEIVARTVSGRGGTQRNGAPGGGKAR
jgi:hypothetical protein